MNEIFIENSMVSRTKLKQEIIKQQIIPFVCQKCQNNGIWLGEKLTLQLDHKNGIRNDNRKENLRFLCPNCHSQTETFNVGRTERKKASITKEEVVKLAKEAKSIRDIILKLNVSDCSVNYKRIKNFLVSESINLGNGFSKIVRSLTDRHSPRILTRKVERPTKEKLRELVWQKPIIAISNDFGVSDVAIHKWCKIYQIEKPPMGYWLKK